MKRVARLCPVALLGLVGTGACIDAAEPDDVAAITTGDLLADPTGAASATGASLRQTTGAYVVPLEPGASAELRAAARFDVETVQQRVTPHGTWTTLDVGFALPAGLVGDDRPIRLSGMFAPGDTVVAVSSDDAVGECTLQPTLDCDLTYYAGGVDLRAVERHWRARGLSPRALAARLQVARLFDADPLGVLATAPSQRR